MTSHVPTLSALTNIGKLIAAAEQMTRCGCDRLDPISAGITSLIRQDGTSLSSSRAAEICKESSTPITSFVRTNKWIIHIARFRRCDRVVGRSDAPWIVALVVILTKETIMFVRSFTNGLHPRERCEVRESFWRKILNSAMYHGVVLLAYRKRRLCRRRLSQVQFRIHRCHNGWHHAYF
jgi:hypothetical protein